MESDNLNQLLVQTDNEKSNQINNLDTEKLDQLKQYFPEFGEFCGQLKYDYNINTNITYKNIGNNQFFLSVFIYLNKFLRIIEL